MPRNVRNFWLELTVDGSKHRIATGPRSAGGGFMLTIQQRDKGNVTLAMRVVGRVHDNGQLELEAINGSQPSLTVKTTR